MRTVALPRIGTFEAWRNAARELIRAGVRPEDVAFARGEAARGLFEGGAPPEPPSSAPGAPAPAVPKAFVSLAREAAHHSDPERFALLYLLLARLKAGEAVMADPLIGRLEAMGKAVRRDVHKTHAFVRFREVARNGPRRAFAAWFEPEHPTLELSAPHFARRFADMDWTIATPDLSASFDGALRLTDAPAPRPPAADAAEGLWQTYYSNIFNPARLKVAAMRAEMPQKYWRNLPEARLIPDLIAGAGRRAEEMRAAAPTLPPAYAEAARLRKETRMDLFGHNSIGALHEEARGCTRCDLHRHATQVVFGDGPADADLMFVGEQPGDNEDLQGYPFVGPAGKLFDQIAHRAGVDRSRAYVTNAVKHFKFEPRGKRRIHAKPNGGEIKACRWWLDQERALVEPKLIVALGATALHALTGDGKGILKRRGGMEADADGRPVFVTVHPSFLLRLPDPEVRAREEAAFEDDLRAVQGHLERLLAA